MYLRGIVLGFCVFIFLNADGCLCSKSRTIRHLDKAVKRRQHAKILEILDSNINVLSCRRSKAHCIENMLLYKGLSVEREFRNSLHDVGLEEKAHRCDRELLDLIELGFRTHYQNHIQWYWHNDPERDALQIILRCDNIKLFTSLMTYSPARDYITSHEGRVFFGRFAHGTILEKYKALRIVRIQEPASAPS